MSKVSIIVPSANERWLARTVDDLFAKATGDIEVIVVLDAWWPDPILDDRDNLIMIHRSVRRGMRDGINSAAAIAKGKYLMKCDAHCMFGEGYDEILQADCEDNWVVIPRRYSLDAENWAINPKPPIDYEHIFYPYAHPDDLGLHARPWPQRASERQDVLVDENMAFQGSCWFMTAEHFNQRIGGLSEVGYESFMGEPQEIGFKTQLGPWGGMVMCNKKTSYAHLHKGHTDWKSDESASGRISGSERWRGNAYSFDFWWHDKWEGRAHDMDWLIEHFWPLPAWPEDWRKNYWKGQS